MRENQKLIYDLIVIGGGIQGVGVAADASGRGLSVFLCEQNDLGSGTSSASTKLIHGGLRYLESYHFGLVKAALAEREVLCNLASHLVKPSSFIMPYHQQRRPFWLIRLGLFCYDLLNTSSRFPASKTIYFDPQEKSNPLKRNLTKGFIYSDAIADDARLVIANAMQAANKGCHIATQTTCLRAQRSQTVWEVTLRENATQKIFLLKSKAIVNASGPWMTQSLQDIFDISSQLQARLVKGSHIVVPKLYSENAAYVLQNSDGRIIFVTPYHKQFSLVGTTDMAFKGSLENLCIEPTEINYLCQVVSDYFSHPLKPQDVYSSWAGVRPLFDDGSSELKNVTREYKLELTTSPEKTLPLVNIFGGKLTTYRQLAENVWKLLADFFAVSRANWTKTEPLPGGDFREGGFSDFLEKINKQYAWLPSVTRSRLANSYGTLIYQVLGTTHSIRGLGRHFGCGLYEKELIYLIEKEWATTAEDILWRRSKLGLFLSTLQQKELTIWMESYMTSNHPQKHTV